MHTLLKTTKKLNLVFPLPLPLPPFPLAPPLSLPSSSFPPPLSLPSSSFLLSLSLPSSSFPPSLPLSCFPSLFLSHSPPPHSQKHPSSDTPKNAPPIPTRFWHPNSKEQSCDSLQSPGYSHMYTLTPGHMLSNNGLHVHVCDCAVHVTIFSNNGLCAGHVTIFSTGGKFQTVSDFAELHALTQATLSYSLLLGERHYS